MIVCREQGEPTQKAPTDPTEGPDPGSCPDAPGSHSESSGTEGMGGGPKRWLWGKGLGPLPHLQPPCPAADTPGPEPSAQNLKGPLQPQVLQLWSPSHRHHRGPTPEYLELPCPVSPSSLLIPCILPRGGSWKTSECQGVKGRGQLQGPQTSLPGSRWTPTFLRY